LLYNSLSHNFEFIIRNVEQDFPEWHFNYKEDLKYSISTLELLLSQIDAKMELSSVEVILYVERPMTKTPEALLVVTSGGIYFRNLKLMRYAMFISFETTVNVGFSYKEGVKFLHFADRHQHVMNISSREFQGELERLALLFLCLKEEAKNWGVNAKVSKRIYGMRKFQNPNRKRLFKQICETEFITQYIKLAVTPEDIAKECAFWKQRNEIGKNELYRELDILYQVKS